MHLTGLDFSFWALSFLGHCGLLAIIFAKHRAASFPAFTTLILSDVVRTVILFVTFQLGSSSTYFYAYWILVFIDVSLQLAVTYELALRTFRPMGLWASETRRFFLALTTISLLIAAGLTSLAAPPTESLRQAIVIRGICGSSVLVSELFVAIMALSVIVGLPLRSHVSHLVQGLGAYSIFTILTEGAHSYFGLLHGQRSYLLISHARIGVYLICLCYWMIALLLDEPEPRKMPEELRQDLLALQQRATIVLRGIRTIGMSS